jgi:hypothetical protein
MKYAAVNAVKAVSDIGIGGLVSMVLKCLCWRMFENSRICRKMAPPRQLKPKLWMSRLIRWLNWLSMVFVYRKALLVY